MAWSSAPNINLAQFIWSAILEYEPRIVLVHFKVLSSKFSYICFFSKPVLPSSQLTPAPEGPGSKRNKYMKISNLELHIAWNLEAVRSNIRKFAKLKVQQKEILCWCWWSITNHMFRYLGIILRYVVFIYLFLKS